MRSRLFPAVILLAVLMAACAPASTPAEPATAATQPPVQPTVTSLPAQPATEAPTETILSEATPEVESADEGPLPIATSRGPDLHATDPTTVSLASGQLQFVEFFRFT